MSRRVLVLGATGKVGGEVFRLLNADDSTDPIAAVRSIEKGRELLGDAAKLRTLDLEVSATLDSALNGIDAALLVTGYTVDMLKQSKSFLDTAKRQGVQHIVHIGASGAPTNEVAHWGWHQLIEAYIEKQGFGWTHLRPEAFMQNITGPGCRWLAGDTIQHYIAQARWTWVDYLDVAAVAAKCLANPQQYASQVIPLGYDSATMDEVAETLSTVTGRSIRAESGNPDDFLRIALKNGADPAYMACIATQFKLDAAGLIPDAGKTYDGFEEIVGRSPVTWVEFAERNRNLI